MIDGLPVVPKDSRQKLIKFLLRKLNSVGHTSEDAVFMPLNDEGMSEGCVWTLRDLEKRGTDLMCYDTDLLSSNTRPPSRQLPPSSSCTAFPSTRSTPLP